MKKRLLLKAIAVCAFVAGCNSTPVKEEKCAITAAKEEVQRRGWKRFEIGACEFVDGRWLVGVVNRPTKAVGGEAIVEVSPSGEIVGFHSSDR